MEKKGLFCTHSMQVSCCHCKVLSWRRDIDLKTRNDMSHVSVSEVQTIITFKWNHTRTNCSVTCSFPFGLNPIKCPTHLKLPHTSTCHLLPYLMFIFTGLRGAKIDGWQKGNMCRDWIWDSACKWHGSNMKNNDLVTIFGEKMLTLAA